MKNKASENSDMENLLRKGLQNIEETPDANTWEHISARQGPKNRWLKIRHYSLYLLPVVLLLLAGLGWWQIGQPATEPTPLPEENKPKMQQTQQPNVPVAELQAPAPSETPKAAVAQNPSRLERLNTVPASAIRFQTKTGLDYQNPTTGTRVHIPANALVDSKGRPVYGTAELTIREYRDIPDFLASGIPMHYADERGSFFFNSGGMFDVRVSQNGEALSMAPGQMYDVEFAPTGELTNASLYYLNEETGAWEYRSDPAFASKSSAALATQPPVVAEAVAVRNNLANNDLPCLPQMPELPIGAEPASWMHTGVQVGYDLATGKLKMPIWFKKRPELNTEQLLNGMERGLIRIVRNSDQGELFFPEDMNDVFTELSAFKDCYFFRSSDSIQSRRELDPSIYWDRVTVKQDVGNTCIISLYSDKEGLLQFYATLTASIGNKDFDANKVFAAYMKRRTERQDNFETLVNNLHRFLYMAPIFQTEDEWCVNQPDWLQYFEAQLPLMAKRYGALVDAGLTTDDELALRTWENWRRRVREYYFSRAEKISAAAKPANNSKRNLTYALRISAFGVYNCDQIFRLGTGEPNYIYAAYKTKTGNRVYAASVSVLERNSRLFFTLPTADKILSVPGRALDVVVTDKEGRQYHLPADQYASMSWGDKRASHTFTVNDITDETRTPRDWATFLDL